MQYDPESIHANIFQRKLLHALNEYLTPGVILACSPTAEGTLHRGKYLRRVVNSVLL